MLPAFVLRLEWSPLLNTVGLTTIYLGAGALVFAFLFWPPLVAASGSWVGRFLAFFGAQSYSIYLWHMVVRTLMGSGALEGWGAIASYVGVSIGVGVVMARVVEWPVLRLRERWVPAGNAGGGKAGLPSGGVAARAA